ncbi:MAG: hypothetical protein WA029_14720, partial [Anaerolineae bacterium]
MSDVLPPELLAALRAWFASTQIVSSTPTAADLTIGAGINAFLGDASMVVSPLTRANHQSALRALMAHLANYGLSEDSPLTTLSVECLLTWPSWLVSVRHLGRQSIQNHLNALSRFLDYLRLHEQLPYTISEMTRISEHIKLTRKAYRPAVHVPRPISDEDMAAILAAAHPAQAPRLSVLRNVAIVHTLLSTGMRVMEMAGITRGQLNADHSATITGKRQGQRVVFFNHLSWDAIHAYLAERAP